MNKNMLSPLGFTFYVNKIPGFSHFCQSVTLPGINLGFTDRPTPFKSVPVYGDHIVFGEVTASFKVNEDLSNYIEIYNWMQGVGFPDEFNQFANIRNNGTNGQGIETDAYIMVHSSNMNPIMKIDIIDMFPTSLSDITMDSRDSQVEYVEATVTFKCLKYTFTPV